MSRHPEIELEQAQVDRLHDLLRAEIDRCREILESPDLGGADTRADVQIKADMQDLLDQLTGVSDPVPLGRFDTADGETWYVAKARIFDGPEIVAFDWRAPAAEPFYRASIHTPMGIWRRRQFRWAGDQRTLNALDDEVLTSPPADFEDGLVVRVPPLPAITDELVDSADLLGPDALLAELERERSGQMRDVVATLQAEQYEIIRSERTGVLVVQGGPGTGKTIVGLHRAAWLLFHHRNDLSRSKVLVVGPNPAFVEYIERVLPSLGEESVVHRPVTRFLPEITATDDDDDDLKRLKGDQRMVEVIRRAVALRAHPLRDAVSISHEGYVAELSVADSARLFEHVRARAPHHQKGRELLRSALLDALVKSYMEKWALEKRELRSAALRKAEGIANSAAFKNAVNRMWESVSRETVLRDLFSSQAKLRECADGILSEEEQGLLLRPAPTSTKDIQWSQSDLPLLDEAGVLLDGLPPQFGHLVVDEAQDLTPMQLRMIGRRCVNGGMTVLGDLAQATGSWAHDTWEEVTLHLAKDQPLRLEQLTIGYRVPAQIAELAQRLLPYSAPGLVAPRAVRRGTAEPRFVSVSQPDMARRAMEEAGSLSEDVGMVGVITPSGLLGALRMAGNALGLEVGEVARDGLVRRITLVDPWRAKGLEFDAVVVVEPEEILGGTKDGLRLLYVALTRATRLLTIVHAKEIPGVLLGEPWSVPREPEKGAAPTSTMPSDGGDLLYKYRSMPDAELWAHAHAAIQAFGERLGLDR